MHQITFTQNFNGKLFNDNFGDVREHNREKFFVGNELEATLKNTYLGVVKVVAVRTFEYRQIRDVLAFLDMGKPTHYMAEVIRRMNSPKAAMPPDSLLDHVVFHYIQRNMQNQSNLLRDWWQSKYQLQTA